VGTAQELYFRPETAFVAGFVGDTNRWQGRVERVEGDALELRSENGILMRGAPHGRALQAGDRAEIYVRPEAIRVAHDASGIEGFDNRMQGRVTALLFNGAASRVLVRPDTGGEEIEVALPQSGEFATLSRGDALHIGWSGAQGNCFAAGHGAGPAEAAG
jgi:spermidine/putrescine transport system ATP-binding protein